MKKNPTSAQAPPRAEIGARLSRASAALAGAELALDALPADDASLLRRADEITAIETARFLMRRAAGVDGDEAAAGETARCEALVAGLLERLAAPARPARGRRRP